MASFTSNVASVTFITITSPVVFGRWFWVPLLAMALIQMYVSWLRWDTEQIRQIVEKSSSGAGRPRP